MTWQRYTCFRFRYDQIVAADSISTVLAELSVPDSTTKLDNITTKLINPLAIFDQGVVQLTDLTVDASLNATIPVRLSVPALDGVAPVYVDVVLAAQCPPGAFKFETVQGNVVCQLCPKKEYEKDGVCLSCPTQVVCVEGSTVSDWKLKAGNWRTNDESDDVRECRFGVRSCPYDGLDQAAGRDAYCGPAFVGPLCSQCAADHFLSWVGSGDCASCDDGTSHGPTIGVVCGMGAAGLLVAALAFTKRLRIKSSYAFQRARRIFRIGKVKFTTILFAFQVRSLHSCVLQTPMYLLNRIACWQVISQFSSVVLSASASAEDSGGYPSSATIFASGLGVTNIDLASYVPVGCLFPASTFHDKLLFTTVAPLVVITLLWIPSINQRIATGARSTTTENAAGRWSIFILELVVSSVSTTIVQVGVSFYYPARETFANALFLCLDIFVRGVR